MRKIGFTVKRDLKQVDPDPACIMYPLLNNLAMFILIHTDTQHRYPVSAVMLGNMIQTTCIAN